VNRFLVPGLGRRVGVVIAAIAIVVQIGVIAGVVWGSTNVTAIRDWLVVGKVAESAQIERYVAESGLSPVGRFFLLAAKPTLHSPDTFAEACPIREAGIAVLGCYSVADDTIHLLDITDDALTTLEPVVAAHEALHAIWARLGPIERSAIATEIEKTFTSVVDPALLGRLAPYENMPAAERDSELFALLGTEANTVTPGLEDVYSRYFDDRKASVRLAASSANIIAEISNAIESVGSQILSVEESVKTALETYKKDRRTLRHDIAVFNTRANTPGYFGSSSAFTRARNSLDDRQRALERSRAAVNKLIDQYNSLVQQMAVLNAQATNLNAALGIDASAMVSVPVEP
jgi:hypothetical protein